MKNKKIILTLLIIYFLFLGFIYTQAEEFSTPARTIGAGRTSSCTCEYKEKDLVCTCECQKSGVRDVNKVDDCHVGLLFSDPVCACCGDCTLNNFLLLGVNVADILLKGLAVWALLFFVIGGIIWITSGGSAERVKKGKNVISGAVIGLVIVLFAFMLVRVAMEALGTEEYLPESSETSTAQEWPICPELDDITASRPWCYRCSWTGAGRGCKSNEVKAYQEQLTDEWGCNCGTADGKFGRDTKACTERFQQANACPSSYCLDVDGMVGPTTRDAYQGLSGLPNPCQ